MNTKSCHNDGMCAWSPSSLLFTQGSRDKISRLAKPLTESGVIGTCMISTCWSVSRNGRMGSGFRFCLGVYH